MCASPNSTLCYISFTQRSESHQLDCSWPPCLPSVPIVHHYIVYDVCCADLNDTSLVVVACSISGIEAFNQRTAKSVWCIKGEIPFNEKHLNAFRITADDHGRLFVRDDGNKCIHIFSVDGKYVTTLLREGEQGLGKLGEIRWSEGLPGLLVAHSKDKTTWISLVKIQF